MRRSTIFSVVTVGFMGLAATASAGGRNSIDQSLGQLRWGMSQSAAVAALVEKIEQSYAEDLRRTRMQPEETEVRRRMKAEIADLRAGHVMFNGTPTRWDGTFLEGEFTHGNGEAMVTYADGSSRNFYFFIDGKLWKWIKAFDQPTFNGKRFDDFARFVRQRFGNGKVKRGARTPQGNAVQYIELTDSKTRLRGFDRLGGDRSFALVFEDKSTLGKLASLRKHRGNTGNRAAETEVATRNDTSQQGTSGRFGDRRSVSAHERPQQETEAQWRQRQARERQEAASRQRTQHERQQEARRGRSLDGLAGISDADPLAGFGQ